MILVKVLAVVALCQRVSTAYSWISYQKLMLNQVSEIYKERCLVLSCSLCVGCEWMVLRSKCGRTKLLYWIVIFNTMGKSPLVRANLYPRIIFAYEVSSLFARKEELWSGVTFSNACTDYMAQSPQGKQKGCIGKTMKSLWIQQMQPIYHRSKATA